MIDYYGYITTMSWRAAIALEELELPYHYHEVNLGKGEQKSAEHRARNPFGKVPVIVDHAPADGGDPITVFESGAILLYLGEKTGRLIPEDSRERSEFYTWFFWVVNGYGAALGQSSEFNDQKRFRLFSTPVEFGDATYSRFVEASREAHVQLDERLADREFICGEYSLADVAAMGSTVPYRLHGVEDLGAYPNLARWYATMRGRPAVERALQLGSEAGSILPDYYREALFDVS